MQSSAFSRKLDTAVSGRRLVKDDPSIVRNIVLEQTGTVDVVIATGGTGLTSRDSTYEAIASILNKRIDGVCERRTLSSGKSGLALMLKLRLRWHSLDERRCFRCLDWNTPCASP